MSSDDLTPPAYTASEEPVEERGMSRRTRTISWIAGIGGLIALIALAVFLSHQSASESQGQGQGGGRHGGRGGGGGGGGGRGGGGFGGRGGGGAMMPTTVGTAKAAQADIPVIVEAIGTVTPAATVTVRPQVSGTIVKLLYREGQLVRKGETLAIIDPRPYQAALLQAQGALKRDQAQLANAKIQLARYNTLLSQDSIARQDRDTQASLVGQLEGTVLADRGAVQQAQINVGFTRIVSPVGGRAGLKVVDVGNYIGAGDANGIVVVTTLQPIDIEFAIPQQQAPQIQKRIAQGASIPADALDSTRTQTLDSGSFSTLDNRVDTTTGTIKGKARFPNVNFQLYPSQFVNVRLTVDTVQKAVTVPPAAIQSGPDGPFVWMLKSDRTVTERKVKLGVASADKTQITAGLALGDTVITDGADRLTEGAKVALPGDAPPAAGGDKKGAGGHRGHRGGQGG